MVKTMLQLWVTVPSCTAKFLPRLQQILDGKPLRTYVFMSNKFIQAPQTLKNVLVIISMELKLDICNKTVYKYSVFKCTFKNPEELV